MSMKGYPPVAMGAWAWGNDGTFGTQTTEENLRQVFDAAMEKGLCLWDTAYVYGMGRAEKLLAGFLGEQDRDSYILSDKFTPRCADLSSSTPLRDMLEAQIVRMGIEQFDIYWIHNASDAPRWITELAQYLEEKENLPMIGVSNHNLAEIQQAETILAAHGLKLSAVQNHYSLINRFSETTGVLDYCKEHDLRFFSYMVLEQGALSGAYTASHPMPEDSARAEVYNPILGKLEPLQEMLHLVGQEHGVSAAQIPVAWAIAKGTLPIIGVTKVKHVEDAASAAQIILSESEINALDRLGASIDIDVNRFWERQMR